MGVSAFHAAQACASAEPTSALWASQGEARAEKMGKMKHGRHCNETQKLKNTCQNIIDYVSKTTSYTEVKIAHVAESEQNVANHCALRDEHWTNDSARRRVALALGV